MMRRTLATLLALLLGVEQHADGGGRRIAARVRRVQEHAGHVRGEQYPRLELLDEGSAVVGFFISFFQDESYKATGHARRSRERIAGATL